jgi:uncharacterized membrane protein
MSPALVLFVLATVVLAALWLEIHVGVFKKLGAAATAILMALVLSNTGLIPGASPVYDFLMGHGVLAGVILVLLGVNLSSLRDAGRPMLAAFVLGAVGSALGATVMALVVAGAVGPETWKLSGQFAATYIGGGMNFAAVGQELGTQSDLFSAGIAADVIVTAIWLVACLVVPDLFRRRGDTAAVPETRSGPAAAAEGGGLAGLLRSSGVPLTLVDFGALTVVTFGTIWASELLTAWWPAIPRVIWLTTVALAVAQVPAVRAASGSVVLGNFLLLLFLASNGAKSVIARIVEVGPAIFYFSAGVVAIHGLIIFGVGRLLKMNADVLSIASQANVGGATTAMSLAAARRRPDLILPGVAAGMLGNAVGNYVGIAIAYLSRGLIG